jgi:hypothetical protein
MDHQAQGEYREVTFTAVALGVFQGVILNLAFGERQLNRVWSACSDHHRPEAMKSLTESLMNYEKALKLG